MHEYDINIKSDIQYYRMETEHIDYINRFNDKVKSNTVLYTRETHKQRDSAKLKLRNKLVLS